MAENRAQSADSGIEERVLALPGVAGLAKPPALLQDFYARMAPKLLVPSTMRAIVVAFGSVDVKAEKIATVLRGNPYYEYHFMRQIEALSKRESLPSVDAAIVLLGMQKTRDLIAALQLLRQVNETHPEWDASGKLKVAPDQVLKFAFATEEAFLAQKKDFVDTGYAAALAYDLLALLMDQVLPDPNASKKVRAFLDDTYKNSVKTAKVAVEIARGMPDFTARRYLIPLCLAQGLGRVVMAMLDPTYIDLVETSAKAGFARPLVRQMEEKKFGVASSTLGVAALQCMRIFRSIERAALFVERPYLLKARDKNLHQLASLVLLSTNVAAQYQVPKGADDPIISVWRSPEVREFKVEPAKIVEALSRVKL